MSYTVVSRTNPTNPGMRINKKYILDEQGNPREVVISYEDFLRIWEMLGLDLDDEAVNELRQAHSDRECGRKDQYVELETI